MRIALGVEYAGTAFYGWQHQTGLTTIQSCVEAALSKIAIEPIQVVCAGRTDAGVHATGQVVHFDTEVSRELRAWVWGTNSHLPDDISVQWAQVVDSEFHARFSAVARRYRYITYNHPLRPALFATQMSWYYRPLQAELMQQGANYLLGEHDFTSFRSADCQAKTVYRNIHEIKIQRQGNMLITDIRANAFLHNMVRNIMGVLLQVGSGMKPPEWVQEVLHAKDRRSGAMTASPQGLYLTDVYYPEHFRIPRGKRAPLLVLTEEPS